MKDALLGYTGFVGNNLQKQRLFDCLYNSKNIIDIKNQEFNLVVCAAAPGTKWIANKHPQEDLESINKLIEHLTTVKCKKFVLISTIDVYSPAIETNEDSQKNSDQPYGKHRLLLEEFVKQNFNCLIIRLPGIFGRGLKKNIIFDLLSGQKPKINYESLVQFYDIDALWVDIQKALNNNLNELNIATEPLLLKQLVTEVFNTTLEEDPVAPKATYDMRSKHHALWDMEKPYLYPKEKVIADLKNFIQAK